MKTNTLARGEKISHENSGMETTPGFKQKSVKPLEVSLVTIKQLREYLVNNEKAYNSNTVQ